MRSGGRRAGVKLGGPRRKTRCPLERLNLRGNALGAEGAIAMSDALKHSKTLTTLNFAHNLIGADGMRALVAALSRDTSVRELMFSTTDAATRDARRSRRTVSAISSTSFSVSTVSVPMARDRSPRRCASAVARTDATTWSARRRRRRSSLEVNAQTGHEV